MKKKIFLWLALVVTVASLASCGETSTPSGEQQPMEQIASSEPEAADAGALGDYHVAVKQATFGKDYEGNPMVVVNYDFTNNSDESCAAIWAVNMQAFQNGIQLETAIAMDDKVYNAETAQKEIKPGVTLENCQAAFVLSDSSTVSVEVTEFISLGDEMLIKDFAVE